MISIQPEKEDQHKVKFTSKKMVGVEEDGPCPDFSHLESGICYQYNCAKGYFLTIEGICDQVTCMEGYEVDFTGHNCHPICRNYWVFDEKTQ